MSLLMSGVFGYLNYELLVDLGEITHTERKENKNVTWILFSIIDYLIYIVISAIIDFFASCSNWLWMDKLTLPISIVIIVFLTMKHAPSLYGCYKSKINQIRKSKGLPKADIIAPRESAFNHDKIFAYIFDFHGNLIHHGFVGQASNNPDLYNEFNFVPTDDKQELNENDVNEIIYYYFDRRDDKDEVKNSAIYIDTKNKLKYYLIYYR